MPYVHYSLAKKAEVVAYAVINGAEAASKFYGIGWRAVRDWTIAAGKVPADSITAASWESLEALALAKTTERIASGRANARETAIVAGIANRNKQKPVEPEPVDPRADPFGLDHLSDRELERLIWDAELELREPQIRAALEWLLSGDENEAWAIEVSRQLSIHDLAAALAEAYEGLSPDEQALVQEAIKAARRFEEDRKRAAEDQVRLARIETLTRSMLTYEPGSMTYRHLADMIVAAGGTVPKDPEVEKLLAQAEAFLAENAS